jgi:hypothetical protein
MALTQSTAVFGHMFNLIRDTKLFFTVSRTENTTVTKLQWA